MGVDHSPVFAEEGDDGERRDKEEGTGVDPYDANEEDPAKSKAVESSLWELQALRNHYCPQVGCEEWTRGMGVWGGARACVYMCVFVYVCVYVCVCVCARRWGVK
jgi:hypothetical protein